MRAADLELIFVPEPGRPDPGHWLWRWSARLSSARFAEEFLDSAEPDAVAASAARASKPIFFIAHSLGAVAVAKAAPKMRDLDIRGAFLVAPPAPAALATLEARRWGAPPRERLGFSSVLVASRTDPWAPFAESEALALDWGAALIDAGEAGRIDAASGHGPWPEGLLRLAGLFKRLG
ncbi:MAG: RBBP9/YdeN family alpha/beta hydrolase [Roseiarcus sp.]